MARGLFISFEGGDGAGKSTQVELLAERLRETHEVVSVREPGGTPAGEAIRAILKAKMIDLGSWPYVLMIQASRGQVIKEVINPALARGAVVIADRFIDSTYAYQGYGNGLDMKALEMLTTLVCGNTLPDITVLLKVSPEVAIARVGGRDARKIEAGLDDWAARMNHGFAQLAAENPQRIKVVNADRTEKVIADEIFGLVQRQLTLGRGVA